MADSPAGAAGAGSAGVANAGSAAASVPLASALAGGPISFVNADVALDGEPVVGSFTVDGLTFAVAEGSNVELVGVSDLGDAVLALPESVSFEGADYGLTSIAPYAFYLSGVTSVELPASIDDVDERAFRSSDVSSVEVTEDSSSYASFDGILYDADLTRLLLIPGGRTGAARISDKAEEVDAAAFSHCAGVTAISVDAGSDHLSSWDGLLYDADGTTLLRMPAGATDITIREGCTAIAAGAMEGCASLASITAPATVTSISPDVFASVPTVSLPAATLVEDAPQLTALVALSATDDDLPEVDPSAIAVNLGENANVGLWINLGFIASPIETASFQGEPIASLQKEASSYAGSYTVSVNANGHILQKVYTDHRTPANGYVVGTMSSVDTVSNLYWWNSFNKDLELVVGWDYNDQGGYKCFQYLDATNGYTLKGFNKDRYAADGVASGGGYAENATLYAIWRANTYTISFNANGGTGALPSNIAATYDQTYSVTAPSLSRKGYVFDGWATSTGGAKAYEPAGPFKNLTTADGGKVTLYAHWSPMAYPVAFDLGSLPVNDEPGSFYEAGWGTSRTFTVEDGRASIPTPVRAGMRFLGWECDVAGLVAQEGSEWRLNCTLLPDVASPALTARWAYAISVDAPAAVTFGEYDMATGDVTVGGEASSADEELDVDSKKGSPVSFKSASKCDIGIEGISCESREGISLIKAKAGQASDEAVRASDLITMQVGGGDPSSRNAVSFALDDALGKDEMALATAFVIPAGGSLPASFRLNLEENGAYVSDDAAGPEPEPCDLAQLSYAFRAIPYGTGQVDATGACAEDMYIPYDAANPFGLADIKAAANDIASRGYDSQWWWICKHLMYADERGKTIAKVKVGGTYHDVQILGVCQDRLTTPVDGREYAGLTFGWKDVYALRQMNAESTNTGGWNSAGLKAFLQSLHAQLPAALQDEVTGIVAVGKAQQVRGGAQASGAHSIFVPSAYEVFGKGSAGYNESETAENSFQYQYFAQGGVTFGSTPDRVRAFNGAPCIWWTRSCGFGTSANWCSVSASGSSTTKTAATAQGVVPCFAL